MRARYYNPDIKRFINQDIKVGDIGSSQSLNRYAYCEGNPVSMVDPFGLCGENANDQGQKSKYQWLHNALDVAGLFFDAADIVNAAIYAYEKDWTNAAICAASAIPAVGAAIIGVAKSAKAVIKAKKAEKIASLAAEASRMTKNAANTLDAFSDTMKAVSKWGDNPLKLVDGVTTETASKALKALETGGDFAKESQKAVWEMKAVVGADGIRLSTKADEGASLLKHGMAGTDGVAKSVGKSSSSSDLLLKAEKARDDLVINTTGGKTKSMVIGAYDIKTGEVVADFAGPIPENISPVLIERADKIGGIGSTGLTDKNTIGVCAEFRTANQLLLNGSDITNIRFTKPIRPRTGEVRPNCNNCLEMFFDILDN